jgi:DNA polymerase-1
MSVADRPSVIVNGTDLVEQVDLALRGLALRNDPPQLFAQDDGLVRLAEAADGGVRVQRLDPDRLRVELAHACEWVRVQKAGTVPIYPPNELLRSFLTLDRWPGLPHLRQLVRCPTLTATGRLVAQPGYDVDSGLFLALDAGLMLPSIPEHPSRRDAEAAVQVLDSYLADFPFSSPGDHDNGLAYLLAAVMRSLRPPLGPRAPTPLFLVDAPTAGTGKGLLIDLGAVIATGQEAPIQSIEGADPAEWRKRLTAHVVRQSAIVHLDNATTVIADPSLCSVLTARSPWTDRILGTNTSTSVAVTTVFVVSGNNTQVRGDMLRRVIPIRLDAGVERPDLRDPAGFRHPELLVEAAEDRGRLLAAALTIGLAWIEAGRPRPRAPLLGSFEEACRQLFGMLEYAGATHGLENLDVFRGQQDETGAEWRALLSAWHQLLGDRGVTAREVSGLLLDKEMPAFMDELSALKLDDFREAMPSSLRPATEAERGRLPRRLGYALRAHQDQVYGTLRLAQAGVVHGGVIAWRVVRHEPRPDFGHDARQAVGAGISPPSPPLPPDESVRDGQPGGDAEAVLGITSTITATRLDLENGQAEMSVGLDEAVQAASGGDGGDVSDPATDESSESKIEDVAGVFATPDYRLVRSAAELAHHLPRLLEARWLGLDTETTGLDALSDRLRLVQLAPEHGPVVVIDIGAVDPRALAPLFERRGPVLVGQHLEFDLGFLHRAGLPIPPGSRLFDTELCSRLLGASARPFGAGEHKLQELARRELGQELPKEEQTSDWSAELRPEQLSYAARDAAAVLALVPVLSRRVLEAGLKTAALIEADCLPFMIWLSQHGVALDVERWADVADAALLEQKRLEQRLTELGGTGGLPGGAGDFRYSTVNWASSKRVLNLLHARGLDPRTGNGRPSTEEDALLEAVDADPLIRVLLDYREAAKRAGAFGHGWLGRYVGADGRVHPDYHQLGASVGRMSASRPNVQQIPRGPHYRSAVVAPPGRVLVKADYSQIDLRVAADLAPDEVLLGAYESGVDVHRLTASRVRGVELDQVSAADRQAAKSTNFGFLYGMGVPRFRRQARSENGVDLSEADARRFRDGFLRAYPGIRAWHRRHDAGTDVAGNYVETPIDVVVRSGRRRLAVSRYTEKLASPVQMTVSDGFKTALANLWQTREQVPSAFPVLVVHDEVVVEVDRDAAERAAEWLREQMTAGMRRWLDRVPVVVETTICRDWSGTPL